jgi:hypothetical protein
LVGNPHNFTYHCRAMPITIKVVRELLVHVGLTRS